VRARFSEQQGDSLVVEIVRERTLTAVSVEQVWNLIEPAELLPRWLAMTEKAEVLCGEGLGRRQRVHGHWGHRRFQIDQTVTVYEPRHALAWRHDAEHLDGKPAPKISAETEFRIEVEAIGRDVLIRLRSRQVPGSWLNGIIVRLVARPRVARMLDESLNRLAESLR
jgi:uncharacterized protein YndB with AHSA1/START domain